MTAKTTDFSGLLYYNPAGPGFNPVVGANIRCPNSMNEYDSISVSVVTWGIPDGNIFWRVVPHGTNLTLGRFTLGSSDNVLVVNNRATFSIAVSADNLTSPDQQSFDIIVSKTPNGPAIATYSGIIVNDTSQTVTNLTPYGPAINSPFDFANPPSGNIWNDDVNQVSATINGTATRTSAPWGSAIVFNGTDTYLDISNTTNGVSNLTISMLADFESANENWNVIYSGGTYGGNDVFAYISGGDTTGMSVGTGDTINPSAPIVNTGLAWWDFVYADTDVTVYKNGVLLFNGTTGSANTGFTQDLLIGLRYGSNGDFLNGTIYRIKGVMVPLDQAAIVSQYNSLYSGYGLPPIVTPYSLVFNGTSDYWLIGGSPNDWSMDNGTIEFWSKAATSSIGVIYTVVCQRPGGGIDIFYDSGKLNVPNTSGGYLQWDEPTPGVWTHVAIYNVFGQFLVYYNGIQQGSAQTGLPWSNGADLLFIGRRQGPFQYFNGELTDIRINGNVQYIDLLNPQNFDPYVVALPPTKTVGTRFLWNPTNVLTVADLSDSAHTFGGSSGSGDDYPTNVGQHVYGPIATAYNGTTPGEVVFDITTYPAIVDVPASGATMTGTIFAIPEIPVAITGSAVNSGDSSKWIIYYNDPGNTRDTSTSPPDTFTITW